MADGSDEPLGLLALAAAAALLPRRGWCEPSNLGPWQMVGATAGVLGYVAVYGFVPPLIRAAFAVVAIACVLPRDRKRAWLPLLALLLLSLPLIASLQYFLGFPLRAATTWCTAKLLGFGGLAVEARGTVLLWAGEEILVDAPCSGIRMLWTAATLSAALAGVHRLSARRFVRLAQLTGAAVFAANVARSTVLFFLETGLCPNPPWAHEAAGLAIFAVALATCAVSAVRLGRYPGASGPFSVKSPTARPPQCKPIVDIVGEVRGTVTGGPSAGRSSPERSVHCKPIVDIVAGAPAMGAGAGTVVMREGLRPWGVILGAGLLALAGMAGVRPLRATGDATAVATAAREAVEWPTHFEGAPLEHAPLHPAEAHFGETFPGGFAAFTDGRRRIVFRRIEQATRKAHPAAGCLRAAGFAIEPRPARRFADSGLWAVVEATRDGRRLVVREQITGRDGSAWTDVSAWYWAALFRPASGPWTAITVIEPVDR